MENEMKKIILYLCLVTPYYDCDLMIIFIECHYFFVDVDGVYDAVRNGIK